MIDDEFLIGVLIDEADGLWEVALKDEDVVGELVLGEFPDAAVEVGAQDVVFVGLVLQDVADGAEFGVRGKLFENAATVGI